MNAPSQMKNDRFGIPSGEGLSLLEWEGRWVLYQWRVEPLEFERSLLEPICIHWADDIRPLSFPPFETRKRPHNDEQYVGNSGGGQPARRCRTTRIISFMCRSRGSTMTLSETKVAVQLEVTVDICTVVRGRKRGRGSERRSCWALRFKSQ